MMYVQISSCSLSVSNIGLLFPSESANNAALEDRGVMAREKGHETTLESQEISSVVRTDMPDPSSL